MVLARPPNNVTPTIAVFASWPSNLPRVENAASYKPKAIPMPSIVHAK